MQTLVTDYLKDGQSLENFKDYAGALTQYRNAYEAHPRNREATERIIELMEKLGELAISSNDIGTQSRILQNLEDVMATDGFLSTHERLLSVREQLEQ